MQKLRLGWMPVVVVLLTVGLVACGGGGGSEPPAPNPPVVEPPPQQPVLGLSQETSPERDMLWAYGAAGRLWRSANGGLSWTAVPSPTSGEVVQIIALGASSAWLHADEGGVPKLWRTDDAGGRWTARNLPIGAPLIFGLSSDGGESLAVGWSTTVGMTTSSASYVSTDGGLQWKQAGQQPGLQLTRGGRWGMDKDLRTLFQSPFGTSPYGNVMHSQDSGATWTQRLALDDSQAADIRTSEDARTLMVLSYPHGLGMGTRCCPVGTRIHVTRDRGAQWDSFDAPALLQRARGVGSLAANGVLWMRDTDERLHRSADFGRNWQPATVPAGFAGFAPQALELGWYFWRTNSPAAGALLSRDQGLSWQSALLPNGDSAFSLRQTTPNLLLAERASRAGVMLSLDAGANWRAVLAP
jgi:photosystem II stability/assembly factor-like uncharacterized protein